MDSMEVAMGLIAQAGDARSSCMEAIGLAKEGKFDDARAALERADDGMVAAHEIQTDLIREEMSGSARVPAYGPRPGSSQPGAGDAGRGGRVPPGPPKTD